VRSTVTREALPSSPACLLGWALLAAIGAVGVILVQRQSDDLWSASTWAPLNESACALRFISAAAAGKLGSGLQSCARQMTATSEYGMRGAAATGEHGPGSVICSVSEEGLLSVSTVRTMMDDVFVRSLRPSGRRRSGMAASHGVSDPAATGATTDTLLRQPSDDRALLAVLLLRERAKEHSPLAPYIRSFLHLPAGVPSGWDPATEEGAARRAELQFSNPKALLMADLLREQIATTYLALVPAAIEATLGSGSPLGGEARTAGGGVADGLREHLTGPHIGISYVERTHQPQSLLPDRPR